MERTAIQACPYALPHHSCLGTDIIMGKLLQYEVPNHKLIYTQYECT